MKGSRRRFLQLAGLSAVGLSAKPVLNAFAKEAAHGPEPSIEQGAEALTAKQWALVIDTRELESHSLIEAVTEACHSAHNVPHIENKNHEIKWIWETHYKHAFPGMAASRVTWWTSSRKLPSPNWRNTAFWSESSRRSRMTSKLDGK